MSDNPLWDYTLKIYANPDVESALIQLQDDFGADVNILLSGFWLASEGRRESAETFKAMINSTAQWRAECIIPLRAVRRYLKPLESASAQDMRERVKVLEVDAEKWMQDTLYSLLEGGQNSADASVIGELAVSNVRSYLELLPGVEWNDVVDVVSELNLAINK